MRALERLLADVYGRQDAVRDGVIPASLVATSAHFHRQAAGIESANGARVHVAGIDLVRDERGDWRVLEDNVRVPSGVSYIISNRRVMAQTLPELFTSMPVRPVGDYPYRLGDRHVYVGHGRDYDDIAPVRGVFSGAGTRDAFVKVEITREA